MAAVSSQSPETVPPAVHQQLTKDFVPAVKAAAVAGNELLNCYHALEKASEIYANALENLAKTSNKGGSKAKEYGNDLNELMKDYKKYLSYHKDIVKELKSIVDKTTTYGNEDKDKLKVLFTKYQKDEKDLQKAQKKGTKEGKSVDLTTFYDSSAKDFLKQQELRYKFFVDKHKRWFAKYWDLLEKIQTERGIFPNGHTVAEVHAPQISEAIVEIQAHSIPQENGVHENEAPKIEEIRAEIHPPEKEKPTVNGDNDDPPFLHSRNSSKSSVSTMDSKAIPSRRGTNENIPGVTLVNSERRASEQTRLSALQEYKFAESAAPHSTSIAVQSEPISPQIYDHHVSAPPPAEVQPPRNKFEYRGPIIVPAPVPRTREPEIIKSREMPIMVPRTVDAPVYAPMKPDNQRYVAPPEDRPHYHVESEYNSSVSPAHRPMSEQNFARPAQEQLIVPPSFNASDYGRTLTVTQDFNATSGEQMTINRGDKVILIKSGTRGWIFIQDQATQRTGWIPAPFVSY